MTPGLPTSTGPRSRTRVDVVVVAALLLTGLSMRTAITSVGAALDDLEDGLHASGGASGFITTLPVICFAVFGALTPRVARRVGAHRLLVLALLLTTAGLLSRAFSGDSVVFAVLTVPALAGAATSNILLPSLVREHFPDRVGPMTAVYTTALAVGSTAAAGITVPLGDALGGWRAGLGMWSALTLLAVLPWLPTVVRDRAARSDGAVRDPAAAVPLSAFLRSRTAWALVAFFAFQSMQAYISFGWFARFLTDHGITQGTAGAMVAVLTAASIPASLIAPRVPPRHHRRLVLGFVACYLVAYVGLAVAPVGGAWVWMVLTGLGSGTFPLALTVIALRARTPETTAALSAFAQGIGYVVAGTGPFLFGALFGATGSWGLPLTVLFVALALMLLAAWPATAPRYVDDELAVSAA